MRQHGSQLSPCSDQQSTHLCGTRSYGKAEIQTKTKRPNWSHVKLLPYSYIPTHFKKTLQHAHKNLKVKTTGHNCFLFLNKKIHIGRSTKPMLCIPIIMHFDEDCQLSTGTQEQHSEHHAFNPTTIFFFFNCIFHVFMGKTIIGVNQQFRLYVEGFELLHYG